KKSVKTLRKSAVQTATKRVTRDKTAVAADAVDEQLARYRSMRNFNVTAEPSGARKGSKTKVGTNALPFVIQKHAASHLHYDFRLGWNGVLKSWAVAKGPSFYPGDRRLAIEVEDHPMEYGGFEGIIPKGQYGGGTVMVWDNGTWEPQPGHEDIDAGLREGSLKFVMHGAKMHGKWTLVRMHSRPDSKGGRWSSSSKPSWLLIKEHDDFERGKDDPAITEQEPDSAITGRTMEQIAANEDHVWNSKETQHAGEGKAWYRKAGSAEVVKTKRQGRSVGAKRVGVALEIASLPREVQPDFIPPQLAMEATGPPAQVGWLHEIKLDGYRIQARKSGSKVQMLTRKGLDWTHRMPRLAVEIATLPVEDATIDGEVVVLAPDGTTSFADLQAAFNDGSAHTLTYFAFDLMHVNGRNTRKLSLLDRKQLLAEVLHNAPEGVRFSDHLDTGGEAMFQRACELHAEGIISKRADAPYFSGRNHDWLKSKCLRGQEFVIGGYGESSEGADRIGSLLLGYYDGGKLRYAGRTGTGFTHETRHQLQSELVSLAVAKSPFEQMPTAA
ncbi:MAG: non-homologous end-joining DNA ligase, partial [Bryocella sp.]